MTLVDSCATLYTTTLSCSRNKTESSHSLYTFPCSWRSMRKHRWSLWLPFWKCLCRCTSIVSEVSIGFGPFGMQCWFKQCMSWMIIMASWAGWWQTNIIQPERLLRVVFIHVHEDGRLSWSSLHRCKEMIVCVCIWWLYLAHENSPYSDCSKPQTRSCHKSPHHPIQIIPTHLYHHSADAYLYLISR